MPKKSVARHFYDNFVSYMGIFTVVVFVLAGIDNEFLDGYFFGQFNEDEYMMLGGFGAMALIFLSWIWALIFRVLRISVSWAPARRIATAIVMGIISEASGYLVFKWLGIE